MWSFSDVCVVREGGTMGRGFGSSKKELMKFSVLLKRPRLPPSGDFTHVLCSIVYGFFLHLPSVH